MKVPTILIEETENEESFDMYYITASVKAGRKCYVLESRYLSIESGPKEVLNTINSFIKEFVRTASLWKFDIKIDKSIKDEITYLKESILFEKK